MPWTQTDSAITSAAAKCAQPRHSSAHRVGQRPRWSPGHTFWLTGWRLFGLRVYEALRDACLPLYQEPEAAGLELGGGRDAKGQV